MSSESHTPPYEILYEKVQEEDVARKKNTRLNASHNKRKRSKSTKNKKDSRRASAKRKHSSSSSSEESTERRSRSRKRRVSHKRRRTSPSSSSSSSSESSEIHNSTSRKRSKPGNRSESASDSSEDQQSGRRTSATSRLLRKRSKFGDLIAVLNKSNRTPFTQGSQNIIPEFNPQSKNQSMKDWILKINESATVYGWTETQTIFFALPRLSGLAKKWYDGLTSVGYTWKQWQEKLLRAFPCEENYGDILAEMLARKSRKNETLEEYYYDKFRLVNRCEISGVKAVDCITQGIFDYNIRMNAQGSSFKEPEEVLSFFRKITTKKEETQGSRPVSARDWSSSSQQRKMPGQASRDSSYICFNCGDKGHGWIKCPKDLIKCGKCRKVGHTSAKCNNPTDSTSRNSSASSSQKVLKL